MLTMAQIKYCDDMLTTIMRICKDGVPIGTAEDIDKPVVESVTYRMSSALYPHDDLRLRVSRIRECLSGIDFLVSE